MTPKQFAWKMSQIQQLHGRDPQTAHRMADALLMDALIGAGYGQGVGTFRRMVRWYG